MLLSKLKNAAEDYIGVPITNAVITVPAYFNNSQRRATLNAGAIAGLNVLRLINEPTAAAIAYGFEKKTQGEMNVLIFDLGGGTFDVTILTIDKGVFEVRSTSGDTHLGGEDFDGRLVMYFSDEFKKKNGKDLTDDRRALGRLRAECEPAKRTLSSAAQTTVQVDALFEGIDFKATITRAKFEELCVDLFESTLVPVEKALADANLEKHEIHDIVLVGGSTRIPRVQKLLQDFFDGKELNKTINPDEAVAAGAAIQAAILNGDESDMLQDLLLLDVTPLSLGVQTFGGKMATLIPRNTAIPAEESKIFSTSYDNQTAVLVQVFQGERLLTKNNHSLGRFQLKGIQQAKSRIPQIEVTFKLDANGILNVTAFDKSTGNQKQLTIKNVQERPKDQIDRMVRDAAASRQKDREHLERIDARNELKLYATHLLAMINQESFKARVDDHDWNKVNNKVVEVIDWLGGDKEEVTKVDYERMRRELDAVSKPVMEKVRQNARANPRRLNVEHVNANRNHNNRQRPGPVIEELD